MPGPAIHWFTSDLRLHDNVALAAAARHGPVAGVWVLERAVMRRAADAPRRVAFLMACLRALDEALAARGSRLLVLDGDAAVELPRAAARLRAPIVTYTRNYEPAAKARAARVARALAERGVALEAYDAGTVHPPGSIRTGSGTPYLVYSAFARVWEARDLDAAAPTPRAWAPEALLADVARLGIEPPPPSPDAPAAGEYAAMARLREFLRSGLRRYPEARDLPGVDGTSRLSYHLRFGTISAAEACREARAAAKREHALRQGARVWTRELAWRDFYAQLLDAFPRVARASLRPLGIRWRTDDKAFRRWQEGTTGIPLVDAGMRELAATGFMHNRARMVTASFLTRHLLIDWRAGERHFMQLLLDAQIAPNNGNWQWVAGTGADAQPFIRIFSPVQQGERFDPQGAYVRRWISELARVPVRHLHAPWTLTPTERRTLCPDYPPPVVDLDAARARALAAFEAARRRKS